MRGKTDSYCPPVECQPTIGISPGSTFWTLYDPAGLPIADAFGQEAHTLATKRATKASQNAGR